MWHGKCYFCNENELLTNFALKLTHPGKKHEWVKNVTFLTPEHASHPLLRWCRTTAVSTTKTNSTTTTTKARPSASIEILLSLSCLYFEPLYDDYTKKAWSLLNKIKLLLIIKLVSFLVFIDWTYTFCPLLVNNPFLIVSFS